MDHMVDERVLHLRLRNHFFPGYVCNLIFMPQSPQQLASYQCLALVQSWQIVRSTVFLQGAGQVCSQYFTQLYLISAHISSSSGVSPPLGSQFFCGSCFSSPWDVCVCAPHNQVWGFPQLPFQWFSCSFPPWVFRDFLMVCSLASGFFFSFPEQSCLVLASYPIQKKVPSKEDLRWRQRQSPFRSSLH